MKKYMILLLSLFLLVGCTNNNTNNTSINEKNDQEKNINKGDDKKQLKDIKIEWCKLYNPNGFDTITCKLYNPNDVNVDASYDVVLYKNGKEVYREGLMNNNFASNSYDWLWSNNSYPKSEAVDEIKLENVYVTEEYYKSIKAKIEHVGITGNQDYFKIKYDKEPVNGYLFFFLYKDINKNGKCEANELNITEIEYTDGKEDTVSVDTDVIGSKYGIDYDSYEIFYNAYEAK